MASFEQLVRPFQLGDTSPPKVIPPPAGTTTTPGTQTVDYGKATTVTVPPTYDTSHSVQVKLYMTAVHKEVTGPQPGSIEAAVGLGPGPIPEPTFGGFGIGGPVSGPGGQFP